jgi:hypothetical protein
MKRVLLWMVVVAVGAVPGTAVAEQVDGTGQSSLYQQVHVNAKDNGNGPRGHAYFRTAAGIIVQGDVTCLNVVGNTARIGVMNRSNGFPYFVQVIDNGSPGPGNDQHRARPAFASEIAPPDCNPSFPDFTPFQALVQGNYVVKPN